MTNTTLHPHSSDSQHNSTPRRREAVPAGRVGELLREITIALHATRVVGRIGTARARPSLGAVLVEA